MKLHEIIKKFISRRLPFVILMLCLQGGSTVAATLDVPQEWNKRKHSYRVVETFSKFEIEFGGKIIVTDNDKDIASISPYGFLKITKSSFGNSRAIEITSDAQGNLTKTYYDGRKKADYNTDGREWLEEILPEVIHKTGIGGKERALRIYKEKGVNGVINAIDDNDEWYSESFSWRSFFSNSISISNGISIRNLYLKTLLDNVNLSKDELITVMNEMKNISSNSTKGSMLRIILDKYTLDSYLMDNFLRTTSTLSYNTERGNVLRKFQSKYKITNENCNEYFNVIESMEINSEKGNVIKPLIFSQKLDNNVMAELIRTVRRFDSNSEKAAILRLLIPKVSDNEELRSVLLSTINSLDDSYRYLREELISMLIDDRNSSKSISKSGMLELMDMALDFEGNTRKTVALRKLHNSLTSAPEVINKYFEVVNSLTNQMERYNLLLDLIYTKKLTKEWLIRIYDSARDVATEDYKQASTAILRTTINYIKEDETLANEYFDVLEKIDHDSGKEEIIRMFCEKGNISKTLAVNLFKVVEDIDVDIETATSLININKAMPKDADLDYIYNSIAKKMESDYEYERAMTNKQN